MQNQVISELTIVDKIVLTDEKRMARNQIKELITTEGLEVFNLTIAQEKEMKEYVTTKKKELSTLTKNSNGFCTIFFTVMITCIVGSFGWAIAYGEGHKSIAPWLLSILGINTTVATTVAVIGHSEEKHVQACVLDAQAKYIQEQAETTVAS